jgi:hypothetical protein
MTTITLPSYFKPVVQGYAISDPGGVLRTEVAGGSPRYGLDWDRGPQQYTVTLILDGQLFSLWTVFYHRVIAKGSLEFTMPLDCGFGVQPVSVNIVPDTYRAERTSGIMTVVSFRVEAENPVYDMTDEDAENMLAVYALYGPGLNSFLDRLHIFANFDLGVL